MDYNSIRERLERTLNSLNARFDDKVIESINFNPFQTEHSKGFSVNFGKDDPETILNKILLILYNLASFKDHLKNCFRIRGIDPQIIENEINNSLHLQVLIDVVNQEKHGSPLRSNRSGKNPTIKNPSQVLTISSGTEPGAGSFFSMYPDGRVEMSGNNKITIDAEIWDDNNSILFRIDELIDTAFRKWENIITRYNCS